MDNEIVTTPCDDDACRFGKNQCYCIGRLKCGSYSMLECIGAACSSHFPVCGKSRFWFKRQSRRETRLFCYACSKNGVVCSHNRHKVSSIAFNIVHDMCFCNESSEQRLRDFREIILSDEDP